MPRGTQSKGSCAFCGQEIAKGGMSRHLASCAQRQEAIAEAEKKAGSVAKLFHLRAQADGLPEFWLDLELRGDATLKDLDHYLRKIWLECCGHMSEFSFGAWTGKKVAMTRRIKDVFMPGTELTHVYDFGTSSITLIKYVAAREGKPLTSHPILLLARNVMPESVCITCQHPAAWLCQECLIEENIWGTLCDEHAKTHPHDEYGEPIPLVNSPRLGMCGYEGPAEPPY